MSVVDDAVNTDGIGRNKQAENLSRSSAQSTVHTSVYPHMFSNEKFQFFTNR